MRQLVSIVFILLFASLHLAALNVDVHGEFRNRAVYLMNKDAKSETGDTLAIFDSRLRVWLESGVNTNLGFVYNLQIGDVSWGDLSGTSRKDGEQHFIAGGSQGTEGINLKTRQMYMRYQDGDSSFLIGFVPFKTPLAFLLDSNLPGLVLNTSLFGLDVRMMYARAYAGPSWNGDNKDKVLASKTADAVDLGDDRNDYFLSAGYVIGEYLGLTGWLLVDDNNRFKHEAPTSKKLFSDLYYWGVQAKGKLSSALTYEANLVIGTGSITSVGEGSESVSSWAFQGKGSVALEGFKFKFQYRMLSGNSASDTDPGSPVQQFAVLDGDEGSTGSWMGLLFGGGPFADQYYFHYGSASARRVNITKGYFVRNDPGITALEFCIEKDMHEGKATFILSGGYAQTTRAVLDADGEEAYTLGVELDIGLKTRLMKELELYIQLAYLFPGSALGPTIALDNAVYSRPAMGTDPVLRIDAALAMSF
ncbi:MAG TPA: hypothetical protein PK297_04425 [Spirochaetota bacterium]|nr:hypothetical protein [Spirochaetota bacterium]